MGLETVEFIITVETHFAIRLEDAETQACVTVGDLERLIAAKLEVQRRTAPDIFETLKRILVEDYDHPPWQVRRETSFVDDLDFN